MYYREKELDALDKSIINELRYDARQSSEELATKLGTSASSMRARVRKLLESGAMKIIAMPNLSALGYKVWALIAIGVYPGQANRVADELAKLDALYTVAVCLGRYDIVTMGNFKSPEELADYVNREIPKVSGVMRTETLILTNLYKYHEMILQQDAQPNLGDQA